MSQYCTTLFYHGDKYTLHNVKTYVQTQVLLASFVANLMISNELYIAVGSKIAINFYHFRGTNRDRLLIAQC